MGRGGDNASVNKLDSLLLKKKITITILIQANQIHTESLGASSPTFILQTEEKVVLLQQNPHL